MDKNFANFIFKIFHVQPKNLKLYQQALTHRSYLNETKDKNTKSFERLEFLGDAVLELYVSEIIFTKYSQMSEGDMTNLRSSVVKTQSLAQIAKEISLGNFLLLSKGEEESGGRENPSILADCFEALIAALNLDLGYQLTKKSLDLYFPLLIDQNFQNSQLKDYKSLLQEITQEKYKVSPFYEIVKSEGPDHRKVFTINVKLNNKSFGTGQGFSKQKAEEEAAKTALEKIGK